MKELIEKWKAKHRAQRYFDGWCYAAGTLLLAYDAKSEANVFLEKRNELLNGLSASKTFGTADAFDKGCKDAITTFGYKDYESTKNRTTDNTNRK